MLLIKASHKEQRFVTGFLWAKELSACAIYSEMRPVYGDKCFVRPSIHVWRKKFARGRENVAEEKQPGCSQYRFLQQAFMNLLVDGMCLNEFGLYVEKMKQ